MNVRIYEATLAINNKERKLTKSIARQFPISSGQVRARKLEQGCRQPQAICKVQGATLGKEYWTWLYLVHDEVAGLKWVAVNELESGYKKMVLDRGGLVDDPALVPTVIL